MCVISDEKKSFFPTARCPHILPFEIVTMHLLFFLNSISACASKYFQTSLSLLRLENCLIKLDSYVHTCFLSKL